jgi:DNA-binding winged helix-turn-helix (wHTH) protein
MKGHEGSAYRFGAFILIPSERLLLLDGEPVALVGKAFDLLVVLVSQAGHLVTKDELLRRVWSGSRRLDRDGAASGLPVQGAGRDR